MTATAVRGYRSPPDLDERVVILAPFGQDACLVADSLEQVGFPTQQVLRMSAFCAELAKCAVGVLTTEALTPESIMLLQTFVDHQPVWSDVPLILLTGHIDTATYTLLARALANVTIIGRPLDSASLVTVVATALRARKKQYQVRDLLQSAELQNQEIGALNEHLKRAMMETHHRVKNSLQLISAFVDIQVLEHEHQVPTVELTRINSHIRALAALHDVLTHESKIEDGSGLIPITVMLEKLFPMLQELSIDKLLQYDIAELRLTARQATALMLVANELVLNAFKHCIKEIDVSLRCDENTAWFKVSDDGPGLPADFDVQKQSNTGLGLVENLVLWDLQGDTSYTNRLDRSGAVVVIRFSTDIITEVHPEPV